MGKRRREENVQGDDVQEPSDDKGPLTRCNPGVVRSLGKLLPTAAGQKIEELGLGSLLKLQLERLNLRKICGDLLDRAVVHQAFDLIELPMGDVSLWVSKEVVQHAVDLPAGSAKLLSDCKSDNSEEYRRMYEALRFVCRKFPLPSKQKASTAAGGAQGSEAVDEQGSEAVEGERTTTGDQAASGAAAAGTTAAAEEEYGDYDSTPGEKRRNLFTPERIENLVKHCEDEEVKQYVDMDMLVRLFIGVAIDRLLRPGTASYVSSSTLEEVHDLKKLREVDWPYMVYQGLKDECGAFPEKRRTVCNAYMTCCVALLIVVLLDCIKGNDLKVNEGGRMYLYDDVKVKGLLKEDRNNRIKKRRGPMTSKPLEAFIFKKWEDTCYAKFVNLPEPKIIEVHVSTEVPERIEVIESLDIEKEYKEHVLDRTRNKCILDFGEFRVVEKTYVECFEEYGHMHSEILHLVCHLWLLDWEDDKIILSRFAAAELLGTYKGTAFLDKELTTEKMKSVNQIFIPIINEGHWSLVVVTKKPEEKVYILDSKPSRHKSEAATVIRALTEHLRSKHSMDISEYRKDLPRVKPQDNNWDCGFHVLLYIKGFESMDIYNLSKEAVFMFRKKLSVELRHHKMNRARPGGPINEVTAPPFHPIQLEKQLEPIQQEEKSAGSDDHHSLSLTSYEQPSKNETSGSDASKVASGSDDHHSLSLTSYEQPSKNETSGSDASKVASGNVDHQSPSKVASGNVDHQSPSKETSVESTSPDKDEKSEDTSPDEKNEDEFCSPEEKRAHRTRRANSNQHEPPRFKVAAQLTDAKRKTVYNYVKTNCNDTVLFKLGDITMTGGQLIKCLEEDDSTMTIMHAFVQCLKHDDVEKQRSGQRKIIFPPENLTGNGMQGIQNEIASWLKSEPKDSASGKKLRAISQRFVIVPIFQHEHKEWNVFFVDTVDPSSNQVSVLLSTTTNLDKSQIQKYAKAFAKQADDAFKHEGYASPFSNLDKISASTVFIKSRPCALASMVYLERYNGYDTSLPRASFSVEEHVRPKLVYFLLHKKNDAQLPPEITSIVDEKKKKKKK